MCAILVLCAGCATRTLTRPSLETVSGRECLNECDSQRAACTIGGYGSGSDWRNVLIALAGATVLHGGSCTEALAACYAACQD